MCRVVSYTVPRACLLWLVHSLSTTLLAFDLLCFVFKAKFAFYSGYLLIFYFRIPVPYDEKDIFFWGVFVLEGLIGLHRTVQLKLLQDYWLGHRLGLLWYWMICFGKKPKISLSFLRCTQVLHCGPFYWLEGYSISSKGFLPTVVDIMVIYIKFSHLVHFSSLIPKMSLLTLAISCLTTSNLPWFMNLMFQVPMQYCSYSMGLFFQHQSYPKLGIVFTLASSLYSFWSYFSTLLQ